MESQLKKKSTFDRILSGVEYVGNKVPNAIELFLWLCGITIVLSFVCSLCGVSAVHPVTGETIEVYNLLSKDGFVRMVSNAQANFTSVSALGMVLVCMLGVGLCEQSGLFHAALRSVVTRAKGSQMKIMVLFIFVSVLADCAGGVGWVVLPPLGAMVWMALGRNPLGGIFAAYATTASAYCANLLITSMDMQNCGYSQTAIDLLDPSFILSPACNWYFSSACAILLVPVSLFVTIKFVEPRLGKFDPQYAEESVLIPEEPVSDLEFKAVKRAGLGMLIYLVVLAALVITGILCDETGSAVSSKSPFMQGMAFFIALLFAIPAIIYGRMTGKYEKFADIANGFGKAMASMGQYIAVIFFLGQFMKYFSWSNLGLIIAIKGASVLSASGLPIIVIMVLFILFTTILNVPMGGAGTKWSVMAPVFVPMFMLLGYNPAIVQMAFRVGDAATNPITPSFAYFSMLLTVVQRYDKRAKTGSLFANMLPYCIASFIVMTGLFVIWFLLGLPFGPGGEIYI